MSDLASIKVTMYGRVQGVFFRAFTSERATGLGLTGYVRNLPGGNAVEVVADGEREKLEKLLDYLKAGPPGAWVKKLSTEWGEYTGSFPRFSVKY